MAKTGLLDLPPELRNRIFAMVMPTKLYLHYTVKRGVVKLYAVTHTKYYHPRWQKPSDQTDVVSAVALLQVNRQVRAETKPVFYYNNRVVVHCHEENLKLVATWLTKHASLKRRYPVLDVEGVTWQSLDCVWPYMKLARTRRIHYEATANGIWSFAGGRKCRLQRAFAEAMMLGSKAGREGKSEKDLKEEFEKWLAAYQKKSYVKRSLKTRLGADVPSS